MCLWDLLPPPLQRDGADLMELSFSNRIPLVDTQTTHGGAGPIIGQATTAYH